MRENTIQAKEILQRFKDKDKYRLPSLDDLVAGQKMLMRQIPWDFLGDFPSKDFWGTEVVLSDPPIRGGEVYFAFTEPGDDRQQMRTLVYQMLDGKKEVLHDDPIMTTLFLMKR